jgi:pimeloyl-ACP methyl ester carboxylesterase
MKQGFPLAKPLVARLPVVTALVAIWALAITAELGAQRAPARIPVKAFNAMPAPPAPNYGDPASWAALPDRVDAADVVPVNDPFGDRQATAAVDVFFIHPTTYRDAEYWNQPIDDGATNAMTDASVIARQASAFNACCRVYAPRYRQASAAALAAPPEMQPLSAYDLAWTDLRAAFRYYLDHWSKGRPFIIAGHSQGAAHIHRWLEEFGGDAGLRSRLVVAYPIGIALMEGAIEKSMRGVPLCRNPRQVGCVLVWNTFARTGNPENWLRSAQQRYADRYGTRNGDASECINPLTFDADRPDAPAARNPGSLPAGPGASAAVLPPTRAGELGATCRGGVLYVDVPPREGYAIVELPGGMLHFNDFDLFYASIRANAVARGDAFLAARPRLFSDAELRQEFAGPPSRFLEIDGVPIHLRDEGTGPPLLLINGRLGSLHMWDPWMPALARKFRVIRIDYPPTGLSGPDPSGRTGSTRVVEVVGKLADALGLGRFHIGGTSNGAVIAVSYAIEHPERIDRVVVSTLEGGRPPPRAFGPGLVAAMEEQKPLAPVQTRRFFAAVLREILANDAVIDDTLIDRYWKLNNREGAAAAAEAFTKAQYQFWDTTDVGDVALRAVSASGSPCCKRDSQYPSTLPSASIRLCSAVVNRFACLSDALSACASWLNACTNGSADRKRPISGS